MLRETPVFSLQEGKEQNQPRPVKGLQGMRVHKSTHSFSRRNISNKGEQRQIATVTDERDFQSDGKGEIPSVRIKQEKEEQRSLLGPQECIPVQVSSRKCMNIIDHS